MTASGRNGEGRRMNPARLEVAGLVKRFGGLLATDDYFEIGKMAVQAARRNRGGCFAVLEGGYNHNVLGQNALALMKGMAAG
jgi:hypothetical protein